MRLRIHTTWGVGVVVASVVFFGYQVGVVHPDELEPSPPPSVSVPVVNPITIVSTNASTTLAKVGDVITLSFTSDLASLITPSATIAGHSATVLSAGGNSWTASSIMTSGDTEGLILFSLEVGNVDASATTSVNALSSGSEIVFDRTAPTILSHAGVEAEATSASGATVSYTSPTADDGSTVSCTPVSATVFVLGTTTVTCNASDDAQNEAIPTTFSLSVVDTTAPIITLNGASPMTLTVGDSFTDPGANASDAVTASVGVVAIGSVDASSAGTYTLTYSAVDAAGNHAAEITRTVTVNAAPAPAPAPSGGGGGSAGGSGGSLFPVAPVFGVVLPPSPPPPANPASTNPASADPTSAHDDENTNDVVAAAPADTGSNVPTNPVETKIQTETEIPQEVAAVASAPTLDNVSGFKNESQVAAVGSLFGLDNYWWWLLLLLVLAGGGWWGWKKYQEYKEQH